MRDFYISVYRITPSLHNPVQNAGFRAEIMVIFALVEAGERNRGTCSLKQAPLLLITLDT
jgi:hypothetical protein